MTSNKPHWPCIECGHLNPLNLYAEQARYPVLNTYNKLQGLKIWLETTCIHCHKSTCIEQLHSLAGVVKTKIKSPADFAICTGHKVYKGVVSEFTARISQGADVAITYLNSMSVKKAQ